MVVIIFYVHAAEIIKHIKPSGEFFSLSLARVDFVINSSAPGAGRHFIFRVHLYMHLSQCGNARVNGLFRTQRGSSAAFFIYVHRTE